MFLFVECNKLDRNLAPSQMQGHRLVLRVGGYMWLLLRARGFCLCCCSPGLLHRNQTVVHFQLDQQYVCNAIVICACDSIE